MKRTYPLLVIGFLISSTMALAYCPDYPNVEQEFSRSDLVFVAKVISEEKVHATPDGFFDGINYRLSVIEPLKGNLGEVLIVFSENSSGRFPMDVGETYLVFTSITPGSFAGIPVYTISSCGNSGNVSEKKDALLLTRKLSRSLPSKRPR